MIFLFASPFLYSSSLLACTALVSLCPGVLCHRPLDLVFHAWLFARVFVPLVYILQCFSLVDLAGELREGMPLAGDRLVPRFSSSLENGLLTLGSR